MRLPLTRRLSSFTSVLILAVAFTLCSAQNKKPPEDAPQEPSTAPTFTPDDALHIFDTLQAALQSYDRKKFLAGFDAARMPNFPAFRDQIKNLFARYDSFTVTYQLAQTGMEASEGVALADFGLDATPNSDEMPDLRHHTQLRLVLAWDGKEWKIIDLSPRAVFQ